MGQLCTRLGTITREPQKIGAELLQRIDAPEIAMELLKEDDYITRSFAAQSLAKHEDLHLKFAEDEHHSVRIIAAENSVDENLISSLIDDKHSSVRRMAISSAAKNKLKLSSQTLESGLSSSDPCSTLFGCLISCNRWR